MPLLSVEGLSAGYGRVKVVSNASFSIEAREILVVVGPNGSGKSTLLKAIFGLCKVFSGAVFFNGEEVTRLPPYKRTAKGMAYLPQVGNVFEGLTVRENLILAGHDLSEEDFANRVEDVLSFLPELKSLLDRKVRTLSGGERQMVALAMCLMRNPSLVMLDEPTAALAPRLAKQVLSKVVALRDERGAAVVLVEQNAKAALEIGDRAILMVSGGIRFEGSAHELMSRKDLVEMYLGV